MRSALGTLTGEAIGLQPALVESSLATGASDHSAHVETYFADMPTLPKITIIGIV